MGSPPFPCQLVGPLASFLFAGRIARALSRPVDGRRTEPRPVELWRRGSFDEPEGEARSFSCTRSWAGRVVRERACLDEVCHHGPGEWAPECGQGLGSVRRSSRQARSPRGRPIALSVSGSVAELVRPRPSIRFRCRASSDGRWRARADHQPLEPQSRGKCAPRGSKLPTEWGRVRHVPVRCPRRAAPCERASELAYGVLRFTSSGCRTVFEACGYGVLSPVCVVLQARGQARGCSRAIVQFAAV